MLYIYLGDFFPLLDTGVRKAIPGPKALLSHPLLAAGKQTLGISALNCMVH